MLYAAIDIHKHAFQAAVLDPESGEVVEERFSADSKSLSCWAEGWRGRVEAVAIEATTGWRWVWRELAAQGFDVRLAEPVQSRALLGRRRCAKTDRLDARWLVRLLAKEMLPESWVPPAEIQELRDRTRLRKALADDRRRWGQRLHAVLVHEGWPCSKSRLLTRAVILHLLLAFPSGRLSGVPPRVLVTAGYFTAFVLQAPRYLFSSYPPPNDVHEVGDNADLVRVVIRVQNLSGVLWPQPAVR
jgi:hypothetical protein